MDTRSPLSRGQVYPCEGRGGYDKFGISKYIRDRIEIYNPCQFPFDHDPDEFIAGHGKSYPRNPLIAETFYLAKDIERWGSGLRRIKEECDAGGVKVELEKVSTGFQVTFYRPEAKIAPQKAEKSSEKIIRVIRENPAVSAQEIAGILGLSSRAVEKHLSKLKEKAS